MVTGLRTPGVASPLQKKYLAGSNIESIVFRLRLTYYLSLVFGGGLSRMISRREWTANSDGTLTPELIAVNPESHCRTSKVATISHGPSVRHSHARWASGEGTGS